MAKRILKGSLIASAFLVGGFLFGPAAIREGYCLTTNKSDIDSLKQRYRMLDSTESRLPSAEQVAFVRRRSEISDWLDMRGIAVDPGIRDEGVEHAPFFIALYGMTCWQWEDMFRYWSRSTIYRTPEYLLSDVAASA